MKNIKKFVKRKGHHIAAVLVVVLILVTAGVCVSIPVIKVTNKRKASKDVLVSNTIQVADRIVCVQYGTIRRYHKLEAFHPSIIYTIFKNGDLINDKKKNN